MKKIIPIFLLLAIIVTLYFIRKSDEPNLEVQTTIYGNVDVREVNLAFRRAGRLEKVYVEEGDDVKAGELVAELDDITFRNALSTASAEVDLARAKLEELLAGYRDQEIDAARAEVKRAEAAVANADSSFNRQKKLISSGATSALNYDSAKASKDEARASLAAARAQLSMLEEGIRSQTIETARAQVKVAETQRDSAETAFKDVKLYASADGVVDARIFEPGAMVNSSTPVVSIALRDPLYLRAYVSEPTLGSIKQGQKVTFKTDTSSKIYHGHIGFISGVAEFTPKTVETTELRSDLVYRVRIVVNDADKELNQGQPVTIALQPAESLDDK